MANVDGLKEPNRANWAGFLRLLATIAAPPKRPGAAGRENPRGALGVGVLLSLSLIRKHARGFNAQTGTARLRARTLGCCTGIASLPARTRQHAAHRHLAIALRLLTTPKAIHRRDAFGPSIYSRTGAARRTRWIALSEPLNRAALAVMVSVVFAGLFGMMYGVVEVPLGHVRLVARLFMIASLVVFGGCEMVFGGELVVLRCLAMMVCCFYGHG
jgi:hypothetical protein